MSALHKRTPVSKTYGRRKQEPSTPISPLLVASPTRRDKRGQSLVTDEPAHDDPSTVRRQAQLVDSHTGLTVRTAKITVGSSLVTQQPGSAKKPKLLDDTVFDLSDEEHDLSPANATPSIPAKRTISPPPLEDLEFDYFRSASPHTPPKKKSPVNSPQLSTRQTDAWEILDHAAKQASPGRGHGRKLYKSLTAKKDPNQKRDLFCKIPPPSLESEEAVDPEDDSLTAEADPHTETDPQRPVYTNARRGRLTYGSVRSYVEDTPSSSQRSRLSDLPDSELLWLNQESSRPRSLLNHLSDDEANTEDTPHIRSVKSIHELRASGVNAKFTDEMEYLLDGLRPGSRLSASRATYLELALKFSDKSFVGKFKAGGFLDRVIQNIADLASADEALAVSSFAMAYIVGCVAHDDGVAQSLVAEYSVVPFLVGMLDDGREIMQVAKLRLIGLSKVAQSLVKDLRDKIEDAITSDSDIKPTAISRRALALSALLRLSGKLGDLVSPSLWNRIVETIHALLAPGNGISSHEIHLAVSILEDIGEQVTEYDRALTCSAVVKLLEVIPRLLDSPAETGVLAILRFAILVTNTTPNCEVICTPATVRNLMACVDRVVYSQRVDTDEYGLPANVAVFCLGLLVNFCDSKAAKLVLSSEEHTSQIAQMFSAVTEVNKLHTTPYLDDVRGYLAILLGSICRGSEDVRSRVGPQLIGLAVKALDVYKETTLQLQEEVGMVGARSVADQIRLVLDDLYHS